MHLFEDRSVRHLDLFTGHATKRAPFSSNRSLTFHCQCHGHGMLRHGLSGDRGTKSRSSRVRFCSTLGSLVPWEWVPSRSDRGRLVERLCSAYRFPSVSLVEQTPETSSLRLLRGVDCAIANAWLCGYMEHEEASKGPMNERVEAPSPWPMKAVAVSSTHR